METLKLGGKTVRVYSSIDELPVTNFQKYNKYLLIDSGIGSDVDSVDDHISKLARLITSGKKAEALQELQNMRQNIYMINSGVSPKHLAFAALIQSVDGEDVTDLSDDGLKGLLERLRSVKRSRLVEILEGLKKKVDTELETYFPAEFISPKEKEAYDRLKERTLLILNSISTGIDHEEEIEAVDAAMFASYKPKAFAGSDSAEINYDKSFESACLLIMQKTGADAKKMTVLQFYNALDMVKRQAEAESKSLSLNKRGRR